MNFFQAIVDSVSGLWHDLVSGFVKVLRWVERIYQLQHWFLGLAVGVLWYAVTYAFDAVSWIGAQLPNFLTLVTSGGITDGVQIPEALRLPFSIANALFPLAELVGFAAFLLPVWVIAVTIRAIKAWIPTVS